MMSRNKKKTPFGQSTLELALALPIIAFLLLMTLKAFQKNVGASDRAIRKHAEALVAFNHGNSGEIAVDGITIIPGRLIDPIPAGGFNPIPGLLGGLVPTDKLVNGLFSKIPFLKDDNIFTAYGKGYTTSLASQYLSSGLDPSQVNWRQAQLAGYAAAIQSDQSTKIFQGTDPTDTGPRELLGAALQGGAAGYAGGGFKEGKDFFGGVTGGLFASDTAKGWFEAGNDVAKGALRGAIAGSVSGLVEEGKLDLKTIATGAAQGAFYTNTVAKMFPGAAGLKDPTSAASFAAVNGAVSTAFSNGGKTTFKDMVMGAATAGIFSGQTFSAVVGDSQGAAAFIKTAALAGGYTVAATAATGGEMSGVASSVFQSAVLAGGDYSASRTRDALEDAFKGAKSPKDVETQVGSGRLEHMMAVNYELMIDEQLTDVQSEEPRT